MPTAIREVINGATKRDPGNLQQAIATANGTPNHDWSQNGMWATDQNLTPVMTANGATLVRVDYLSVTDLLPHVGVVPMAIVGQWQNSTVLHEVTIRQDPSGNGNYLVTNMTGNWFLGSEISITRNQAITGQFTAPNGNVLRILPGTGYSATPTPHP